MSYKAVKVSAGILQISLHGPTSDSVAMFVCPEWKCCTRFHTTESNIGTRK